MVYTEDDLGNIVTISVVIFRIENTKNSHLCVLKVQLYFKNSYSSELLGRKFNRGKTKIASLRIKLLLEDDVLFILDVFYRIENSSPSDNESDLV